MAQRQKFKVSTKKNLSSIENNIPELKLADVYQVRGML